MDVLTHFRSIEELTKTLSREQSLLHNLKQLNSNNSELQRLINLIHNERKAYDQKGYINGTRSDDTHPTISDK